MNTVSIEPKLMQEVGTSFFLEWQVKHYALRIKESRRDGRPIEERVFLRRTLHGLKQSLAAKLN
jgi:hypothetical protein